MSDFNGLLTGNVLKARQTLRKILRNEKEEFSPLVITPIMHEGRKTLAFRGQILPSYIFNNVGAENSFSTLLNSFTIPIEGVI